MELFDNLYEGYRYNPDEVNRKKHIESCKKAHSKRKSKRKKK